MTTLPPPAELTLEQYMAACLDATQRETRTMVPTPGNPPSGAGDDRPTVPVLSSAKAA